MERVSAVALLAWVALGQQVLGVSRVEQRADFPWALYDHVRRASGEGNVIFSPASVYMALGMVYPAARGSTAVAMQTALQWPPELPVFEGFMKKTLAALSSSSDLTLESANRIYVDQRLPLSREYQSRIEDKSVFAAKAKAADFQLNAEAERVNINDWVEQKTHGLIRDLFPPGLLDSTTQAVIVNALYLKASWKNAFDVTDTHTRTFTTYANQPVRTSFLQGTGAYEIADFSAIPAQLIRIPYKAKGTSFNIILPKPEVHLSAVEDALTNQDIHQAEKELQLQQGVELNVPKFESAQELQMKDALTSLGLGSLFVSDADLTGMTENNVPLVISDVVHKARISVTEKGTEAAAATGIHVVPLSAVIHRLVVTCDRPFLFYIKRNAEVLFVGRLADVQPA